MRTATLLTVLTLFLVGYAAGCGGDTKSADDKKTSTPADGH